MRSKARSRWGHQEAASASHGPAGTNFYRAPASEIRFWKDFLYWHGDFPIHEKYENPAVIDDFLANHVFFFTVCYLTIHKWNLTQWNNQGTLPGHRQRCSQVECAGKPRSGFFLGFDRLNKHQIVGNNYKKRQFQKSIFIYDYIYVYSIFSIFFYFRLAMLFLNNFRPVQEKYASCCLPDWSICKISGVVNTSIIKRDGKTAWAVAGPASPRRMTLVSRRWWATTQRKVGSHIFRKWFQESTHTIEKAQN